MLAKGLALQWYAQGMHRVGTGSQSARSWSASKGTGERLWWPGRAVVMEGCGGLHGHWKLASRVL